MARHALILATDPKLLSSARGRGDDAVDYTTRVGGLGLLKRAILSASRSGHDRCHVLLGEGGQWLQESLCHDKQLPESLQWLSVDALPGGEHEAIEQLAREVDRPFTLIRANRVFAVDTLNKLRENTGLAPLIVGVAAGATGDAVRDCGLYLAERRVLEAARKEKAAAAPLEAALTRMASDGSRAKVDLHEHRVVAVRSKSDRRAANDMLMASLTKPHDGVVSKKLNRRVSTFITRRVMDFDVFTPNLFTVIALAVGLASAMMVATGEYMWIAFGGILYQLSSILDGNDGEIARLKFQGSNFGGWFDTVSDDITNLSFVLGLGIGVTKMTGHQGWIVFALVAVAMALITIISLYSWLLSTDGQTNTFDVPWEIFDGADSDSALRRQLTRALAVFNVIGKRDFYALLFALFCIAGQIQVPLVMAGLTMVVMGLLKIKENVGAWLTRAPEPIREVTVTGVRRR